MCITICGRFRLNEGGVAGYGNRMRAKYTANWGVQIVGMIFQTRSSLMIAKDTDIINSDLPNGKGNADEADELL